MINKNFLNKVKLLIKIGAGKVRHFYFKIKRKINLIYPYNLDEDFFSEAGRQRQIKISVIQSDVSMFVVLLLAYGLGGAAFAIWFHYQPDPFLPTGDGILKNPDGTPYISPMDRYYADLRLKRFTHAYYTIMNPTDPWPNMFDEFGNFDEWARKPMTLQDLWNNWRNKDFWEYHQYWRKPECTDPYCCCRNNCKDVPIVTKDGQIIIRGKSNSVRIPIIRPSGKKDPLIEAIRNLPTGLDNNKSLITMPKVIIKEGPKRVVPFTNWVGYRVMAHWAIFKHRYSTLYLYRMRKKVNPHYSWKTAAWYITVPFHKHWCVFHKHTWKRKKKK